MSSSTRHDRETRGGSLYLMLCIVSDRRSEIHRDTIFVLRKRPAMNSSSKDQRVREARDKSIPTQPDLEALASFRHALRQFLATADIELERYGLGPRRYQAMLAIQAHRTNAPISVGELAELLLIRHNTTAELVKRLERAGLVTKWFDPADRRRALLALTDDGRGKLEEIATAQLRRLHESRAALLAIFGLQTPQGGS